jgi:hypothetical protein
MPVLHSSGQQASDDPFLPVLQTSGGSRNAGRGTANRIRAVGATGCDAPAGCGSTVAGGRGRGVASRGHRASVSNVMNDARGPRATWKKQT